MSMSRGINKVILIGNLGQDPEVKQMPSGNSVANLTVATSESWKDKNTGETQTRTEWHRVAIFGKVADIAGQYLRKGSKVYLEGQLRTRKWQDQSGQDRYTTEIVIDMGGTMQMLDGPSGEQGGQQQQQRPQQQQQQRPQQAQGGYQQQGQRQAPQQQPAQGFDNFDDDIPF